MTHKTDQIVKTKEWMDWWIDTRQNVNRLLNCASSICLYGWNKKMMSH